MRVKNLLSVLICVIMLLSTCCVAASALQAQCDCGRPPLVYVVGQSVVYDDPSSPDKQEAVHASQDEIIAAAKEVLPYFAKAVVTQKWDEYCDSLCEAVAPFFEDYVLSNEGTVTNSSGVTFKWSPETLRDNHASDSVYSYEFRYDPRLDPWETADELNEYIEAVKSVTGHSTVCLLSRCMGTDVAMAYLIKYASKNNFADIDTYILYNATVNGFSLCGELYSGKLQVNADNVERYASDVLGSDYLNEFLKASVSLLNKTYSLDIATSALNGVYAKIYENVIPRIFRATYGTAPGYWGMVDDKNYEQAKSLIFGEDTQSYSVLINKLDNYHYNVQFKTSDMVLALKRAGVKVGIVCKYGLQMMPITQSSDLQSDNTIDLYSQSFGASCSKLNETLGSEYLSSKHISFDKQVDASTCLLPECTWFIKNLEHMSFPNGANSLLIAICRSETQLTVDSDESYPQYIVYDEQSDSISPMTEENCITRDYEKGYFEVLRDFIKAFFDFIGNYLKSLLNKE